jgi:hypothetical protein
MKLLGKLVWVPVILLCKIFIPSSGFDALLCRNWPLSPPNRETLWITLLKQVFCEKYQAKVLRIVIIILDSD